MSWPIVSASGGPRERGRTYGEAAARRVGRSVEIYEEIFRRYAGLTWADVRDRAGAFAEAIDAYDTELLPEIEGIAAGAGLDAEDVLALNLRTEMMFGLRGHAAGCTAVCVVPAGSGTGGPLIAQNWDWKPAVRDTVVVLACAPAGRPPFITLVEAGLLAKCGLNEAGVGVVTNALESSRDRGEPGVPFHAILRRVHTSWTFEEARAAVVEASRASSANYLIAHRSGRAVDLEVTPGGPEDLVEATGDVLAHANHFLWEGRPFADLGVMDGGSSRRRQERATALLGTGRGSLDAIREALRDHEGRPGSVCAHRNPSVAEIEDYVTIASVAMDLAAGTLWVTQGPPCEASYEALRLADLLPVPGP
jgi:isopenicillin-N N-acyltransferase-like protein